MLWDAVIARPKLHENALRYTILTLLASRFGLISIFHLHRFTDVPHAFLSDHLSFVDMLGLRTTSGKIEHFAHSRLFQKSDDFTPASSPSNARTQP